MITRHRTRSRSRPRSRALLRLAGTTMLAAALLGVVIPAPAGAATGAPALPTVDTRTWVIDANTMTTANIQEDSWFSDGDEPYIAVIGYRSRFGTPGSTNAVFIGGLRELSGGADDGDVLSIPDSMGRVSFPSVTRLGLPEIAAGANPEVVGTITVAMESDATPWSSMNSIFTNLSSVARTEIANVIETTTLLDVVSGATPLADRFEQAVQRIEDGTRMTTWQQLGLFLQSWADPDDKIAFRFSALVAVDDTLTALVDTEVAKVLPPDKGFGGGLANRTASITFSGDGARYVVGYAVS
jgi:hypothetical protein